MFLDIHVSAANQISFFFSKFLVKPHAVKIPHIALAFYNDIKSV